MRTDEHYDEEVLASLAESPATVAQDAHLASCETCQESLTAYRQLSEVLADAAVWEEQELSEAPNPATIATLRAFADRLDAEEAAAEPVVAALLETPRESWMSQLGEHPEWRTAGMVRRLIAAAERAIQTMPPDAVRLSHLAVQIAESLDSRRYERSAVDKRRAAAWRTYAYALYYGGDFTAALRAVETAASALTNCAVNDYDAARIAVVRAYIFRSMEDTGAAYEDIRKSAAVFHAHGDENRSAIAAFAYAYVLLKDHRYREALGVFHRFASEATDDQLSRLALLNIGFCHRELGEFQLALQYYQLALEAFQQAESATSVARVEWNIAGVLLAAGRFADAHPRLIAAREAMTKLGMHADAAIANLEIAEILLAWERYDDVAALCGEVIRYYEAAGVAYSRHAMSALAFMQEAARGRKATIQLVRHVRQYVARLPQQPNLLFAHPPS